MQKLTTRQLEVMKELIEKRNNLVSMSLHDYYIKHNLHTGGVEWYMAHNNRVLIYRNKYPDLVIKHLEQKQYIEVVERGTLYIWVRILKEI